MENIGILDPEGINNNPLTGLPYTEQYLNLSKIWSKFPVYKKRNEFINAISKNQVLIRKIRVILSIILYLCVLSTKYKY